MCSSVPGSAAPGEAWLRVIDRPGWSLQHRSIQRNGKVLGRTPPTVDAVNPTYPPAVGVAGGQGCIGGPRGSCQARDEEYIALRGVVTSYTEMS